MQKILNPRVLSNLEKNWFGKNRKGKIGILGFNRVCQKGYYIFGNDEGIFF